MAGHTDIVRLLPDCGSDPEIANFSRVTPAGAAKTPDIAQMIRDAGGTKPPHTPAPPQAPRPDDSHRPGA